MGARTKEDCDQLTIQRGFALLRNGTEGNDGLAPPEGSLEREFEENANGRFPSFLPSFPSIDLRQEHAKRCANVYDWHCYRDCALFFWRP